MLTPSPPPRRQQHSTLVVKMRRTAAVVVVVAAAPRRRFQGRNIFRTVTVHILTILTPGYPDCRGVAAHHATHSATSAPPPTTLHCEDTAHYHNKLALPVVTKLDRVQLDSNFYANVQWWFYIADNFNYILAITYVDTMISTKWIINT